MGLIVSLLSLSDKSKTLEGSYDPVIVGVAGLLLIDLSFLIITLNLTKETIPLHLGASWAVEPSKKSNFEQQWDRN